MILILSLVQENPKCVDGEGLLVSVEPTSTSKKQYTAGLEKILRGPRGGLLQYSSLGCDL